VAHPKKLSWIVKARRKNDRVDSTILAKPHLARMIPESHLFDEKEDLSFSLINSSFSRM
jgi:hypothetical protein